MVSTSVSNLMKQKYPAYYLFCSKIPLTYTCSSMILFKFPSQPKHAKQTDTCSLQFQPATRPFTDYISQLIAKTHRFLIKKLNLLPSTCVPFPVVTGYFLPCCCCSIALSVLFRWSVPNFRGAISCSQFYIHIHTCKKTISFSQE